MILRRADLGLDGEVLRRLHVERDARDLGDIGLDTTDDLARRGAPLGFGAQNDLHAPSVERRVAAVDADEGGQAGDVLVFEDRLGEIGLQLAHAREGDRLRRLGDALDDAGVLHRKEPLRRDESERGRQNKSGAGDGERHILMIERDGERPVVDGEQTIEPVAAASAALPTAAVARAGAARTSSARRSRTRRPK